MSSSAADKYLANKLFFRAEVTLNGKVTARLKGRYNTQEQLDNFIKEHWPYEQVYKTPPDFLDTTKMTIWRYTGLNCRVWKIWQVGLLAS